MDRKMKIVLGIAAGVALTGVAVAVYKSLKCLQQARELDECDCGCCHGDDDDSDCCENCSPDYLSIEHEDKEDKGCGCGCEDEKKDEAAPDESAEDKKEDGQG